MINFAGSPVGKDQEPQMSKVISAHDLGINLHDANEKGLFQWLIASFLMGKRIQAEIAADAYRVIVEKHQRDTPRKLANSTHRELVAMLGEARYVRYDETTADRLLALAKKLNDEYAGKVGQMVEASADRQDLEKRLETFEGVGAKTVEIFMREAARVLY
jgi:endonuclease III